VWGSWYRKRRTGVGEGRVEALTARHVVHAARIGIVYAAVDGADELGPEHVRAGIAWCDYSLATVERIYTATASGRAHKLLDAVRKARLDGLDGTGQRDVFGRNLTGEELQALRDELERRHLIVTTECPTRGRSALVSYAISPVVLGNDQTTETTKGVGDD
jgi:hypothetical protein